MKQVRIYRGYIEELRLASIGKKNIINDFCLDASANEQACAECHIGFSITNDHFDFNNAVNVDCYEFIETEIYN